MVTGITSAALVAGGSTLPAAQAAKPKVVKTDSSKVATKKKANKVLKNTPKGFRKFIVKEVAAAKRDTCQSGEKKTGHARVYYYHRKKKFAAGGTAAQIGDADGLPVLLPQPHRPVVNVLPRNS